MARLVLSLSLLLIGVAALGCDDFTAPGPGSMTPLDMTPVAATPCQRHSQCPSQVCDSDGVVSARPGLCVPSAATRVVTTSAELLGGLQQALALRLLPGSYLGAFQVSQRGLVLVGPLASDAAHKADAAPAELRPQGLEGPVLQVLNGAQVTVDGVALRGGLGTGGHGVLCDGLGSRLWLRRVEINGNAGRGVEAHGALLIDQSIIGAWHGQSGNLLGGVSATADVTLWNSFVVGNGGAQSAIGALSFVAAGPAQRRLAHVTIVGNLSNDIGCAIQCVGGTISPLWRSLSYENFGMPGAPAIGQCIPTAVATDEGDIISQGSGSVLFTDENLPGFRSSGDLHLAAGSPAIDAVPDDDGGPLLPYDFDGDPRPYGPHLDFGADEWRPG